MIVKRFIPILIVAFITGFLFRLAEQTGNGLFRMFGTQGIAVIGILASQAMRSWQREDGIRRLHEATNTVGKCMKVVFVGYAKFLPIWIVQTPQGHVVLAASDIANSARQARMIRNLSRQYDLVLDVLENANKTQYSQEQSPPVFFALIRKKVKAPQQIAGKNTPPITILNPEHVKSVFMSEESAS